ncbi:hypothetical protein AB0N17_43950 [Streptomyces sp. NPDC051133]|uniref:hypothetical protein n=1 Tax=Streptomyces sp. NPDC051133 TaxID=3155521 RepID=UPI00343D6954
MALGIAASPASAAAVVPQLVGQDATCDTVVPGDFTIALPDVVQNGMTVITGSSPTATLTTTTNASNQLSFDIDRDYAVRAVIVFKGGEPTGSGNAYVYSASSVPPFPRGIAADTGLTTPIPGQTIDAVTFCLVPDPYNQP